MLGWTRGVRSDNDGNEVKPALYFRCSAQNTLDMPNTAPSFKVNDKYIPLHRGSHENGSNECAQFVFLFLI